MSLVPAVTFSWSLGLNYIPFAEDKPNFDLPKQGRTYSTAEALTEETFDDKQPSQLLIHPTEYPDVKTLLGTVFKILISLGLQSIKTATGPLKKEQLTKYESRNLPSNLTEKVVSEIDDDSEWKILFNQVTQQLQESPTKTVQAILGWVSVQISNSRNWVFEDIQHFATIARTTKSPAAAAISSPVSIISL